MSETVKSLVKEISSNLTQVSSSQKDEVRVMRAMLNDTGYEVSVYGKGGKEGTYNPAKDFRGMCANIISSAAKIPQSESEKIVSNYEVRKSDATTMVNISKEFTNTFMHTGRKLPLGGREKSNVSLSMKKVEATIRDYPKKVGVNDDGTDRFSTAPAKIAAHESIRVHGPCPSWVK